MALRRPELLEADEEREVESPGFVSRALEHDDGLGPDVLVHEAGGVDKGDGVGEAGCQCEALVQSVRVGLVPVEEEGAQGFGEGEGGGDGEDEFEGGDFFVVRVFELDYARADHEAERSGVDSGEDAGEVADFGAGSLGSEPQLGEMVSTITGWAVAASLESCMEEKGMGVRSGSRKLGSLKMDWVPESFLLVSRRFFMVDTES